MDDGTTLTSAAQARYSRLTWNTPLSEEHADLLIEQLDAGPESSVLDLGCGWGELLTRVVENARSATCTGTGVDTDRDLLERGRTLIRERGLDRQVTLIEAPAQDWSAPADRIICIGSSHAWGGTRQALASLVRLLNPGGRLLFGDGCWEHPPTTAAATIFDDVVPLSEVIAFAQAENWRALHLTTASQREWDEFESRWRLGTEEWIRANPDAGGASALRDQLDERLAEYVGTYRGVLGFCYLVLTR